MPTKLAVAQVTVRVMTTVVASLLAKSVYENINDQLDTAFGEAAEDAVSEA